MINESYACQYAMGVVAFQGMLFELVKVFIMWYFGYKIIRFLVETYFKHKKKNERKKTKPIR